MGEEFRGDAAIQIQRVRKHFEDKHVLRNVSFTVQQGSIHGVVGLSGAGKTTLLNCLVGYYDKDGGMIRIHGQRQNNVDPGRIGFATQETCFYEDITVKANITYFGELNHVSDNALWGRASQLLKLTGLSSELKTKAGDLSGGMKRRFDLVLSLLHGPDVLILDEPATGLDPKLRKTIWTIIRRINMAGRTIIISSHLLNDLEEICTEISLLHNGTIISTGTPRRLRDVFSHHYELRIQTEHGDYKALLDSLNRHGVDAQNPTHQNNKVVFTVTDPNTVVGGLDKALNDTDDTIRDVSIEKPGLESLLEKVG